MGCLNFLFHRILFTNINFSCLISPDITWSNSCNVSFDGMVFAIVFYSLSDSCLFIYLSNFFLNTCLLCSFSMLSISFIPLSNSGSLSSLFTVLPVAVVCSILFPNSTLVRCTLLVIIFCITDPLFLFLLLHTLLLLLFFLFLSCYLFHITLTQQLSLFYVSDLFC